MKDNTISSKTLHKGGKIWLDKTMQILKVQEYGKGSIRNYVQKFILLFKHYKDVPVEDLRQEHVEKHLIYIKENHKEG